MARTTGQPRLVTAAGSVGLEPLSYGDRRVDESWLQEFLDAHPDVLPIQEIGAAWGPLLSLGREIPTSAGAIDNLFVSPSGELTVVEAKLWRNPEARRKVVGQILDYAAVLARMSFEELEARIGDATGTGEIWARVQRAFPQTDPADEAQFHDTLTRNLREGRFLLLAVGDGIREDIEGLADLFGRHPDLSFHLELVELKLFRTPTDEVLVIPSLVGRTQEVTRAIVRVEQGHGADVRVTVNPLEEPAPNGDQGTRRIRSASEFIDRCVEQMGDEQAAAISELMDWWSERGGVLTYNRASVNLGARFRHSTGGKASLVTLSLDGQAQLSAAPLTEWRSIFTAEEIAAIAHDFGFTIGHPGWPRRFLQLDDPETLRSLQQLLALLESRVRSAENALDEETP